MNNSILGTTKTERRQRAIELLQAQLKKGVKPISKGQKPYKHKVYGNPVWSHDLNAIAVDKSGKPIRLDVLPLDFTDRGRIEAQIATLERKIAATGKNKGKKQFQEAVMNSIDLNEGWPKESTRASYPPPSYIKRTQKHNRNLPIRHTAIPKSLQNG